jgi:hypothetical protein
VVQILNLGFERHYCLNPVYGRKVEEKEIWLVETLIEREVPGYNTTC